MRILIKKQPNVAIDFAESPAEKNIPNATFSAAEKMLQNISFSKNDG